MLTSLTYANADGTRTAIVERCDSGDALFLWSVTCRDYGQSDHCLTGYLHFCQRIARRWVQQGHPPAGAAPGGRAVSPAHGGRTMMTEQRLQEMEQRAEQAEADMARLNLERLTVMERALKAEAALAQAQAERDEAQQQVAVWETVFRHSPSPVRPVAQPPALPPLPNGWEPYDEGAHTHATFKRGSDMVEAIPGSLEVVVDALATPADLITVLRHAEAAHLKLKGGAK